MKTIRSLLSNLFTLLLSLTLAIFIWITAIQETEEPTQTRFLSVPVEFINQPDDSVLISPDTQSVDIQVAFDGPASVVREITADDFSATVDLGDVPVGTTTSVNIEVQLLDDRISQFFQPVETIDVRLEAFISRPIPIRLDLRGDVALGHTQGEPLLEPGMINVSGAASEVEPLDFARVTIVLNNDRETVIDSGQPIFFNNQGSVASVSNLTLSHEEVVVTVPIDEAIGFGEKFISVDILGQPAQGYRRLRVTVDPPSVLIQGRTSAQINEITQLKTEPIDITGLTESFQQQTSLILPEGIALVEDELIIVTIEIEPIFTTDIYDRIPDTIGLDESLKAIIDPEEVRIVLFGPLPVLDGLTEEEVRATIDLFELEVGTYSIVPAVNVPDRGIEVRSISPEFVTVTITQAMSITNQLTNTVPITETSSSPLVPLPERMAKQVADMANGVPPTRSFSYQHAVGLTVDYRPPCHIGWQVVVERYDAKRGWV